jgi:hypothetical protein
MVPCRPRLAGLDRAYGDEWNEQIKRLSDGAPPRLCSAKIQASHRPLSADRSRAKPRHLRSELHGNLRRRPGISDRGYETGLVVIIFA